MSCFLWDVIQPSPTTTTFHHQYSLNAALRWGNKSPHTLRMPPPVKNAVCTSLVLIHWQWKVDQDWVVGFQHSSTKYRWFRSVMTGACMDKLWHPPQSSVHKQRSHPFPISDFYIQVKWIIGFYQTGTPEIRKPGFNFMHSSLSCSLKCWTQIPKLYSILFFSTIQNFLKAAL